MSINELRQDSEEFLKLIQITPRLRVKQALVAAKAEVDREIAVLELKQRQAEERKAGTRRYVVELNEYAWDQSDKFVKIFINLNGVQNLPEENVIVNFTANSMHLTVKDLNNRDYGLVINHLLHPIDVESSYRKIKTGMVAVYMKKQQRNMHWEQLTSIQQRLKEKQKEREDAMKPDSDEPEDALLNMMKKMYQAGDSQTKQMIAKAWTEGQQKSRMTESGGMPDTSTMDF